MGPPGTVGTHQNVPDRIGFVAVRLQGVLNRRGHPIQCPLLVELQDADELPGATAVTVPLPQPPQQRLVMCRPPEPPPTPPFDPAKTEINPVSARRLTGGELTPLTAGEFVLNTFFIDLLASSILHSDEHIILQDGDSHRAQTSCVDDMCTIAFEDFAATFDLSFGLALAMMDFKPIMRKNGMIDLAEVSGQIRDEDANVNIFGYGGWMDESFFFVRNFQYVGDDASLQGARSTSSMVIGDESGTNPTSGSGRWNGVMVGIDISNTASVDNRIQGDAEVRIDDFLNPQVDVDFRNIFDLHTERARPNMNWRNIPLVAGSFEQGSGGNQIQGKFYGDAHEEAAGVFERNMIVGAFGAVRDE